jgi:glutamate-5-semialdehyde dehydrogenase
MAARLATKAVEFHADADSLPWVAGAIQGTASLARMAEAQDWATEYNNYILNVAVVDGVESAIHHIHSHGSGHSEAIVTADRPVAERFLAEVDSAAVYWNASTRFTDGGEYGMGAEIGISTDKIGARGPMGLDELCSYKWQGFGSGQVRA